jgi:hypothetical protein
MARLRDIRALDVVRNHRVEGPFRRQTHEGGFYDGDNRRAGGS